MEGGRKGREEGGVREEGGGRGVGTCVYHFNSLSNGTPANKASPHLISWVHHSCTDLQLWDDSTSLPAMLQNRFLKTCRQAMTWRKTHQGYYQVGILPKVQGRSWPHTKVVTAKGS